MPFFVIKKGLVLLEWKYFPTPKILDPVNPQREVGSLLKRIKANPMHFWIGLGMIGIGVWLSLNDHYFTWPPGLRDFANEDAVDMLFVVTGISMVVWTLDDYRTPTWDHIQLVAAAMLLSALTTYQFCHWVVTGAPMPWISNGVITAYVVILAKRSNSGHAMAGPDTPINK